MSSTTASSTTLLVSTAVLGTATVSYLCHKVTVNRLASQYNEKRLAERKGRIRAEVKLRSALKQQQQATSNDESSMTIKCIGTVISPYTKRMGTPRQGALVPSSRGYIEFTVAPQAIEGIELYSHIWVVFEFHANTDIPSQKTKIKPPRAPHKVGMLATRSPHRTNPLGLSLVKVESVKGRCLHISALDLVNGTPVYDIKPFVPWDIPGNALRVPDWVSREDTLPRVEFEQTAALRDLMDSLAPVYRKNEWQLAQQAIQEILAQDPRSGHKRGTTTTDAPYNIVFGLLQVEFVVEPSGIVRVVRVSKVEFPDSAYVDGIPLASELQE